MNNELQNAVAQVLIAALNTAKQTGHWLQGQMPEVLHQLIRWNLIQDSVTIFLSLLFMAIYFRSVFVFSRKYKQAKKEDGSTLFDITDMPCGIVWIVWFVGGLFGLVSSVIGLISSLMDGLEIFIAPKVWLLEYATHLYNITGGTH